ncbi:hypothetical protein [Embleya sp. MST-111070]|uniref:hypothetical protein n=1 Tax=Embleya sp. MST-111070 TaxID=3398231 RepID=UPI003F73923E
MTTATAVRDPRAFVTPEVWDREVALLVRDHPFDTVTAARILGQAIAYLITAMETPADVEVLGVGQLVDHGVHALILDTAIYADFCARHNNGEFLHHSPAIERKRDGTVGRTADAIEAAGFEVDRPLWEADLADCSPCAPGTKHH